MKNALLFCIILLSSIASVSAQGFRRSLLKVRLSDRSLFTIEVDGRRYDKEGTSLTVGDLPAGRHSIRIYRASGNTPDGGYRELVYRGRVQTEQGTTTFCVVDVERGTIRVRVADDGRTAGAPPPPDHYGDDNRDNSNRENDRPAEYDRDNRERTDDINGLSDRDVEDIRARAEKRITDTDKESLLKSALENRACNTRQLAQMLRLLSFESTKLDFVKWAYDHTSDRNNFWKLESEFTFSSSKEELNKFIQGQR